MDRIDLILYVMVAIFSLNIVSAIVRSFSAYFLGGNRLHRSIRNKIDSGEFVAAIELCESSLAKRPYDSQLLWLEGEAYFRHQNYTMAQEKFEHIASHEPSWADEAKKYIDAIAAKT